LYTQNEQLWLFIQELQDANKTNAHLMRTEVKRYQDELMDAQKERRRIAEQLVTARNSKKVFLSYFIRIFVTSTTLDARGSQQRAGICATDREGYGSPEARGRKRIDSVWSSHFSQYLFLTFRFRSKAENALLEHTLQERVSQMTSVHHQLDELRHEAREERDLERASDFYLTNKAILQSAYRYTINMDIYRYLNIDVS
jgi:hypothetical protein